MSSTTDRHPRLLPSLALLLENPAGAGDEALEAHALLNDAIAARATDVHLDPVQATYRIRLRIDGRVIDAMLMDAAAGLRVVNQFKVLSGLNPVPARMSAEGGFSWQGDVDEEVFLRVTAVNCVAGEKMAIRFLTSPHSFRDTLELGIGEQAAQGIRRWMDATGGMLLVAGPTGAGKTTTLYTLLNQLRLSDSHVVTLEDPVEYEIPGINQIQVDGHSGLDFVTGTRSVLRLDPDYVLVGEVRSPASAQACLNVASSGRSLMGTLHSRDAVGVVSSLRHLELTDVEISANLGMVIAQRLVRRLCEQCCSQGAPASDDIEWLDAIGLPIPERVWLAKGCPRCNDLGYQGRIGVFEVWQLTPDDHARILRHADEAILRRALLERGEVLMLSDGLAKAEAGITTLREVLRMGAILSH